MQEIPFDYDVFLSFAASDEPVVRPIWQHLTVNGVRVFWSDVSLRQRAGNSWFEAIQDAIPRSRHFVLVCSRVSLESKWVKREYVAFYNYQFSSTRRLIPLLTPTVTAAELPLFLRELESIHLGSSGSLHTLIEAIGGVDMDVLRRRLAQREEEVASLQQELQVVKATLADAFARQRAQPSSESSFNDARPESEAQHRHAPNEPQRKSTGDKKFPGEVLFGIGDNEIKRLVRFLARKTDLPEAFVAAMLVLSMVLGIAILGVITGWK